MLQKIYGYLEANLWKRNTLSNINYIKQPQLDFFFWGNKQFY